MNGTEYTQYINILLNKYTKNYNIYLNVIYIIYYYNIN